MIHGGPGAPGGIAPIARNISNRFGVLEPFQTKKSIEELVSELLLSINRFAKTPVILLGHSWGAWLAVIFAARYPKLVKKLLLIGAGSFESKYNTDMMKTRMNRLSDNQKSEAEEILQELNRESNNNSVKLFSKFGKLMASADSYKRIPTKEEVLEYQPDIFKLVWKEAKSLRGSGKLVKMLGSIKCPVTAIHGTYDPHPIKGVEGPLSLNIDNFIMHKLEKCGHYPWIEEFAQDKFYKILYDELNCFA